MNFLTLNGVNRYGLSQQRHYQHPGPFQLGVLSVTDYFTAAMQHPACHYRGSMARVTACLPLMYHGTPAFMFEAHCSVCVSGDLHTQVVFIKSTSPLIVPADLNPAHPNAEVLNWNGGWGPSSGPTHRPILPLHESLRESKV